MPATGIEPVLYRYNRILSPARLPVPPRRHTFNEITLRYTRVCFANSVELTNLCWSIQWAEVDSNHRSNLQQIYSLSPLATRESAHTQDFS